MYQMRTLPTKTISIHAPRAGSDGYAGQENQSFVDFNPRSPCGERQVHLIPPLQHLQFQSTLPVRGATDQTVKVINRLKISIHAPRAGSDVKVSFPEFLVCYFNPRSPCGERRFDGGYNLVIVLISIHAPRAGSDAPSFRGVVDKLDFNPRSPCGERRENRAFI